MVVTAHNNESAYTLTSMHMNSPSDSSVGSDSTARSPLLSLSARSYGATFQRSARLLSQPSTKQLFKAAFKMAIVFVVSTALLSGTLWVALPTLDE
jgi:hypothetical protein